MALMANGGELNGVRVLSEAGTVEAVQVLLLMLLLLLLLLVLVLVLVLVVVPLLVLLLLPFPCIPFSLLHVPLHKTQKPAFPS